MDKKRWLSKNLIYRVKRPEYGTDDPCCTPARSGLCDSQHILDVWLCDSRGNLHPGFNVAPVPMIAKNIGEAVNDWPVEGEVYE